MKTALAPDFEKMAVETHAKPAAASTCLLDPVFKELTSIADYVAMMKAEIAALQANEFSSERLPSASGELNAVMKVTASAAHSIMSAGEEILDSSSQSFEAYRDKVEMKILEIFEACAFQDLTGQRIAKVSESLAVLEKRLRRFAQAVGAEDAPDAQDDEERRIKERRETLILNGPQDEAVAVDQSDIDTLFD